MKTWIFPFLVLSGLITPAFGQQAPDIIPVAGSTMKIWPVMHASLALSWNGKVVYSDPTGGPELYKGIPAPDVILITHIHPDHLDVKTILTVKKLSTVIVAPQAVADMLPAPLKKRLVVLSNNSKTSQIGISITAIPMYNLPEDAESRHKKGQGNAYILSIGGKNVYISGDTEDTPEMRGLGNIYVAFVCMNLPYTMDIQHAAEAVLAFKPAIVYPFHYRGQDINAFKKLVNAGDPGIEVRLRNWYPKGE